VAATVRISFYGGAASEPAGANAEGGFKYNRADSQSGTTAIPKPTSTGTAFSFVKQLALEVTGAFASAISDRGIRIGSSLTSGLTLGFLGHATYLDQTGGGGQGSDSGSNGAVPSGYAAVTTSNQTYHSNSASANSTGRNGNFCRLVLGVDNTYAGGAGSAIAVPDHIIQYTET
jgi:hypothetical protein